MTRRARRAGLGLVVTAVAAPFVIDWLHVSDEERVESAVAALQAGLEARDVAALEAWIEPDVPLRTPVPGFPTGQPLLTGLKLVLAALDRVSLAPQETTITFPEDGRAQVHVVGVGSVQTHGLGGPFSFEVDAEFARQPDARFLLHQVGRVRIDPGLR